MLESVLDFGLAVSTLGALIALLPGIPPVARFFTDWGEIRDLENAKEAFPVDATDTWTFRSDDEDWFSSIARVARQNTGIDPDVITWEANQDAPSNMDLDLQSASLGESYSIAEPTLIHDWIEAEQDRIRRRRNGYILTLGAFVIGLGFLIQLSG